MNIEYQTSVISMYSLNHNCKMNRRYLFGETKNSLLSFHDKSNLVYNYRKKEGKHSLTNEPSTSQLVVHSNLLMKKRWNDNEKY